MQRFEQSLSVSDLNLACALLTVGCLPDPRGFFDKFDPASGGVVFCHFLPGRKGPGPPTLALIEAWERTPEEFKTAHPEDPFSYIMTFCENRSDAHKVIRGRKAKAIIEKGNSLAMVDPNSPRAIQETILQLIGI